MATGSSSRVSRNQPWLNPLIGGFCMVAANFFFFGAVHRMLSNWSVLFVTFIGCLWLVLSAVSVTHSGTGRAKALCYGFVAVGLGMAVTSVVWSSA